MTMLFISFWVSVHSSLDEETASNNGVKDSLIGLTNLFYEQLERIVWEEILIAAEEIMPLYSTFGAFYFGIWITIYIEKILSQISRFMIICNDKWMNCRFY